MVRRSSQPVIILDDGPPGSAWNGLYDRDAGPVAGGRPSGVESGHRATEIQASAQLVALVDAMRAADYERAESGLRELTLRHPLHAGVSRAYGEALFATGKYAAADLILRRALVLSQNNPAPDLASHLASEEELAERTGRLRSWLGHHPDDRAARFVLGYVLCMSGRAQAARDILDELGRDEAVTKLLWQSQP